MSLSLFFSISKVFSTEISLTAKIQLADFEAVVDITTVARCNLVINLSLFTNQLLLIELLLLLINVCCVTTFYLLTAKTGRLWGCCCPCQLQLEGKQLSKTVKEKQQRRRFVNENITTQPNSCLWRAGIVVYEKSSTKSMIAYQINDKKNVRQAGITDELHKLSILLCANHVSLLWLVCL